MYTLLYLKLITNKDHLDSKGKSAQHPVITQMEKEFVKE